MSDDLIDALDHIMRVAHRSRTQSKRDRWIAYRAYCALHGLDDWQNEDVPKMPMTEDERLGHLVREHYEHIMRLPADEAAPAITAMLVAIHKHLEEEQR